MKKIKSVYGKECEEIAWVKKFRKGYVLQREYVTTGAPKGEGCWMTVAYTFDGHYIGNSKDAYRLCQKREILPEKSRNNNGVCSIGYCDKEKKWYGWSHRAIFGFGIGSEVKEGDCCASSGWIDEYLEKHPEADKSLPVGFKAKNLDDCKKMAIAFADSVG